MDIKYSNSESFKRCSFACLVLFKPLNKTQQILEINVYYPKQNILFPVI